MREVEDFEEDEISLFELFEKLREGWRYVVGGGIVGVLIAVTAIFVFPNRYEAVAIVQVGQVGGQAGQTWQPVQAGQAGQYVGVPVEPATQAIERMKSAAFQKGVSESMKGDSGVISAQLIKSTAAQGPSALIELKAISRSPEAATKTVEVSVQELAKRHAEISKPSVDRLIAEADLAQEKLKQAEVELEGLNKLSASAGIKDDRFTQLSLITSLRLQKEAEIFSQRQMVINLKAAMNPPTTESAKAIEAVLASDQPVSPKKGLLLVLGLVGGLLAGIMWVFVSGAWRQAREHQKLSSL